jgi:hypothetical protein
VKKPKQPVRPGSAPPFQKWAERDFLADTMMMHWQARMFYRSLLQSGFSTASTRPNLPSNPDQLRRLLGGVPADVWAEHSQEVLAMFTLSPDGLLLTHRRLQEDFGKLQDYRHAQSIGKTEYWDGVRAKRIASESPASAEPQASQKLATTEPQASQKLATTEPQASSYQEDVDSDVDLDSDSENEKESEGETPHSPPLTSSEGGQEKVLTDFIIKVAKGIKTEAAFNQKSKTALGLELSAITPPPTEAELRLAVSGQVVAMDDFALQNAGSRIASSLVGAVGAIRDAAKAAQNRKDDKQTIERSEIARNNWRKKLDEATDIDQYVQDNPPPECFVEYEGGKKSFPYADEYIDEARKSLARREEPKLTLDWVEAI